LSSTTRTAPSGDWCVAEIVAAWSWIRSVRWTEVLVSRIAASKSRQKKHGPRGARSDLGDVP
jgi:hypothetical protein